MQRWASSRDQTVLVIKHRADFRVLSWRDVPNLMT